MLICPAYNELPFDITLPHPAPSTNESDGRAQALCCEHLRGDAVPEEDAGVRLRHNHLCACAHGNRAAVMPGAGGQSHRLHENSFTRSSSTVHAASGAYPKGVKLTCSPHGHWRVLA